MTSAEPFPAAKLPMIMLRVTHANAMEAYTRVQNSRVCDVECGGVEFFEYNLGHAFAVCRSVPCSLGHKYRVLRGVAAHDLRESVIDEWRHGVEVLDCNARQ